MDKVKQLNNYEIKELMRGLAELERDVAEYNTLYPSSIKTCELLLSNMKYYCTEEWENFVEKQKKEFGEDVWEK